jgi:hypothetical protein
MFVTKNTHSYLLQKLRMSMDTPAYVILALCIIKHCGKSAPVILTHVLLWVSSILD